MAKRFTDTNKWRNEWFKGLSPHAKLIWVYLCDDCDHAGIWMSDFEVMSIRTGIKIDEAKFKEWLGQKVIKVDPSRYFVPSFFDFQYGASKEGFRAKQSALASLQKYGLVDTQGTLIEHLVDTPPTLSEQSMDCHSISISKSKSGSKSNTGSAEGAATSAEYEAVYQQYPKKVGKSDGLEKLKKSCPLKSQLDEFEKAMVAYVAKCKVNETFFKQFDTFVNSRWKDCLDPAYGDTETIDSGPGHVRYRTMEEILADDEKQNNGEAS